MGALVIYDSMFGNTEAVARAIADGIGGGVKAIAVADVDISRLETATLVVVGSPTQGGKPTAGIRDFLGAVPANALVNIEVAAFDTRLTMKESNFALRFLMRLIGFAAPRIASRLKAKGGELVVPAEGFIVEGREGPLGEGELARARSWAAAIATAHEGRLLQPIAI